MDRELLRKLVIEHQFDFKKELSFVQRILPKDFSLHLKGPEVTVVTGVRRCGKSTFFRQVKQMLPKPHKAFFFDLEEPLLDQFSVHDFQAVYEIWLELEPPEPHEPIFIFYDEIQNIENWERWVRKLAKNEQHKIFVTGSNSQMLSSELASALTGRHRPFALMPFSFFELRAHLYPQVSQDRLKETIQSNQLLENMLRIGGFPRAYLDQNTSLLPLYFNDILTKDILKRHKIKNSQALIQLGEILCRENTRLFNKGRTSQILNIKDNSTFSKYCSYFKETFLFYEVRQYSASLRQQLRSLSKFYCVDPALPRALAGSASSGFSAEFENLVFLELKRRCEHIFYWISAQRREVDFVLKEKNKLLAVQVAYSVASPETLKREVEALIDISNEFKISQLYIITASEDRDLSFEKTRIRVLSFEQIENVLGSLDSAELA